MKPFPTAHDTNSMLDRTAVTGRSWTNEPLAAASGVARLLACVALLGTGAAIGVLAVKVAPLAAPAPVGSAGPATAVATSAPRAPAREDRGLARLVHEERGSRAVAKPAKPPVVRAAKRPAFRIDGVFDAALAAPPHSAGAKAPNFL